MMMKRLARPGFSLLELTLVIMLMGILMAVVAYSIPGMLQRGRMTQTWASMRTIKNALNTYNGFNASFPPTLSALQAGTAPILDPQQRLQDAWKQDFIYTSPGANGRPFDLYSKGPNGVFEAGAGDDFDIWKEPQE